MSSSNAPSNLLIFTTSQSPLYIRFARPRKPNLILPPLIHRSLHSALDNDPPSLATTKVSGVSTVVIPDPDTLLKHDVPKFHNALAPADNSEGSDPNVDSQPPASHSALAIGDEVDAEVTVKIHLGGNVTTTPEEKIQWVHEALRVLAERKGLQGVDTLLIGFRGVDYKGKKTAASEFFGCGAEGMEGGSGSDVVDDQVLQQVKAIWEGVSKDLSAEGGDERQTEVKTIGTLYLPLGALKELSETQYPPKINSLDTPDCHHLPQEYAGFAKERDIELWAGGGGEGSDPLPAADLHNLLNEFVEARPELLSGASDSTSGLLGKQIPLREDGLKYSEDIQRGVEINWILGYTLVSKTRNVLKDKGYIVSAKILG